MPSQLEGVSDALKQMRALTDVADVKVLRPAVREAGRPIAAALAGRVPVGDLMHRTYKGRTVAPGFLSRSLRFIVTRDKKSGAIFAIFGVRKEAFYGLAFVERGTVKRAAQKWAVPAFEASRDAAVSAFTAKVLKGVAAVCAKAKRALAL